MKYEIGVRICLGQLLSPVKELEDSVNKIAGEFGFDEKMVITSILPSILTVTRALTTEEQEKITSVLLTVLRTKFSYAELEYFKQIGD